MNCHKCGEHLHKEKYSHMEDEYQETSCMKEKMTDNGYSEMCSDLSQMKCKVEKECVKTYKSYYKIYKVCQYRLYKICPCCGHEFDYHKHRGMCPKCGVSI